MVRAATVLAWMVAIAGSCFFVFVVFLRPTDFFVTSSFWMTLQDAFDIDHDRQPEGDTAKRQAQGLGRVGTLWDGALALPVTMQWGALCIVAISAAVIRHQQRVKRQQQEALMAHDLHGMEALLGDSARGPQSAFSKLKSRIRFVLMYPLPPHQLWVSWCGGLNVLEVFLVLAWTSLAVGYALSLSRSKYQHLAVRGKVFLDQPLPAELGNDFSCRLISDASEIRSAKYELTYCSAKALGLRALTMIMAFPAPRSSFLRWLFGASFSTLIKYHRWMCWGTLLIMTGHGLTFMSLWAAHGELFTQLSYKTEATQRNMMGLTAATAGMVLGITSISYVRTNFYWIFYRAHIFGFVIFTTCALMHFKGLVYWAYPTLILYGLDRAFRWWQLSFNWTVLRPGDVHVDGTVMTVHVYFEKACAPILTPGQTVYLRVPRLSVWNAHPFSCADVLETEEGVRLTVHMRVKGPWTCALRDLMLAGNQVWLQFEGPYESKLDFIPIDPEAVVMISGGVGITPLLGLLNKYRRSPAQPPRTYLLWSSRALCEFRLLPGELLSSLKTEENPMASALFPMGMGGDPSFNPDVPSTVKYGQEGGWLQVELHYTGKEDESKQHKIQMNPLADHAPPKPLLGPGKPHPKLWAHPTQFIAVYIPCVILAFVGAWLGLLAIGYYDMKVQPHYIQIGFLEFLSIAPGAVLPPLVFVLLFGLYFWHRGRSGSPSAAPPVNVLDPSAVHPSVKIARATKLDRTSLDPSTNLIKSRAAANSSVGSFKATRRRPDICNFLQRVLADNTHVKEIPVLVAGTEGMYHAVEVLCAELSSTSGTILVCSQVTHQH